MQNSNDIDYISKRDYFYDLPAELIAQSGTERRSDSRLLVIPGRGPLIHKKFYNILDYLKPGDLMVFNNSKVIPARIYAETLDSKAVELLLLKRIEERTWQIIGKPGKRLRIGQELNIIKGELTAKIKDILPGGERLVEFQYNGIWEELLDRAGEMPLPPYINEKLKDRSRYNTVYAKIDGSAAAPTAGLHFSNELLEEISKAGIETAEVTLHVGLGTFRPVKEDNILEHEMHSEYYQVDRENAKKIREAKAQGRRIIAVGTTSARVLESMTEIEAQARETNLFIYPPYEFKLVDALITNFHLPESTLLMLVSALIGRERVFYAYEEAVKARYRFFSLGDACLFLPAEDFS